MDKVSIRTSEYKIHNEKIENGKRFALVSDLHAGRPDNVIEILKQENPDYILIAGDIFECLDGSEDKKNERAFALLSEAARIAPSFYCTGNHEDGERGAWWKLWRKKQTHARRYSEENRERIDRSGVVYLEDSFAELDGIAFGGLASGLIYEGGVPNMVWLEKFEALDRPKVLLCHHPEYYERYLKSKDIDLIVSGHAHGGQWQIFGRGVFAPGQGLLPKYTHGVHDGRFVISRGLKSGFPVPRIFNPREVVIISIKQS